MPLRVSLSGAVAASGDVQVVVGLPAWAPAVGEIADVGLNSIQDVGGSDAAGIFAYSGIAHASWWGDLGSLIITGGGHGDGVYNGIYRYDIATRTVTQIKPDATAFAHGDNYIADTVTGWMWDAATGTGKQVGEAFTAHFYGHLIAVPPAALAGAANGWLVTPSRNAMPLVGSAGTAQSHKLALGTEVLWTMQGDPLTTGAPYGAGLYDSLRNRVVQLPGAVTSVLPWFSMADGTTADLTLTGGAPDFYYHVADYMAADDRYVSARMDSGTLVLYVINPATGAVVEPSVSGTPPSGSDGAWAWVEVWRALVYYPGSGNDFYMLAAPANPVSGTWAWSSQTVAGSARTAAAGSPPYNRLRYVLDGMFMWLPIYDQPAQAVCLTAP